MFYNSRLYLTQKSIKTVEINSSIRVIYFFSLFPLTAFMLMTAIKPAYGIRLTHVKLLFKITDQLSQPSDVSVSKDGRIYVVDGVNNKIRIYSSRGNLVSSFGKKGSGSGEFRYPLGIDIDSSGKVYIADSGNHRIQIFNLRGDFIDKINVPSKNDHPADPTDVAVDENRNRCYVVDNDNHCILVYDLSTFKLIKTFGKPGTEKRAFMYPFLITLDHDKYLYIVDVINTRIQVLNPEGLFVAFIGGWGVEKGELFRPKGVAVDKYNRVYISDSHMGVIQVFKATGDFHSAIGSLSQSKVKKFNTPTGIFIDQNNRLYVVEMFANQVSVFSIEGTSGSN